MERKIGEIFEYNNEWYQCVKQSGCRNCAFYNKSCHLIKEISCNSLNREREERYIFKKLEKIGGPYQYMDGIYQQYKATLPFFVRNTTYIETTNGFAIKQNKEDMEENKLNLKLFDLQKAREGKPVCTRDGRNVRILGFDAKGRKPISALVESRDGKDEEIVSYTNEGKIYIDCTWSNDLDLVMCQEKGMWVARDKDGSLWLYEEKPSKQNDNWLCASGDCQMLNINVFPKIKWGDDEPLELISKPIKGEENMEEYENKLRTFNLDEAKAGKPVCTRDGRNVRIICFDCKIESFPIVALVSGALGREEIISYNEAGYSSTREPEDRLFMLPEKKTGYINVYNKLIYNSEEDAKDGITDDSDYVRTIKVEWEE